MLTSHKDDPARPPPGQNRPSIGLRFGRGTVLPPPSSDSESAIDHGTVIHAQGRPATGTNMAYNTEEGGIQWKLPFTGSTYDCDVVQKDSVPDICVRCLVDSPIPGTRESDEHSELLRCAANPSCSNCCFGAKNNDAKCKFPSSARKSSVAVQGTEAVASSIGQLRGMECTCEFSRIPNVAPVSDSGNGEKRIQAPTNVRLLQEACQNCLPKEASRGLDRLGGWPHLPELLSRLGDCHDIEDWDESEIIQLKHGYPYLNKDNGIFLIPSSVDMRLLLDFRGRLLGFVPELDGLYFLGDTLDEGIDNFKKGLEEGFHKYAKRVDENGELTGDHAGIDAAAPAITFCITPTHYRNAVECLDSVKAKILGCDFMDNKNRAIESASKFVNEHFYKSGTFDMDVSFSGTVLGVFYPNSELERKIAEARCRYPLKD